MVCWWRFEPGGIAPKVIQACPRRASMSAGEPVLIMSRRIELICPWETCSGMTGFLNLSSRISWTWVATFEMAGGSVPLGDGAGEGGGGCSHNGFAAADPLGLDPEEDDDVSGMPPPVQAAPSR